MAYAELAPTLGWALRLLRYYRVVPEAIQRRVATAPVRQSELAPATRRQTDAAPPPVAQRVLPVVGEGFTGKVVDGDEQVFVIQIPGFAESQAVAVLKRGPGVPNFRLGKDSAKVEVVAVRQAKSGKTILEVQRTVKKG
ncbi:hypothetical protein [Candidatus Viridilinea mediisalina]|uniref:Uncharacterized protein n=1 Tax=Candidatus Viridilinea mediisalina TaxID=2024553 RepID=A0A2A6RMD7_9CHLR|nr:hypothetical protein [Candidatus Viridilinea mediisalina]PDW04085.1 hypothetical protein CJ255_05180 [Candidatus Viridilinea mediisalina]